MSPRRDVAIRRNSSRRDRSHKIEDQLGPLHIHAPIVPPLSDPCDGMSL